MKSTWLIEVGGSHPQLYLQLEWIRWWKPMWALTDDPFFASRFPFKWVAYLASMTAPTWGNRYWYNVVAHIFY